MVYTGGQHLKTTKKVRLLHIPTAILTKPLKDRRTAEILLKSYRYFVIEEGKIYFYNRNTVNNNQVLRWHLHEFSILDVEDEDV